MIHFEQIIVSVNAYNLSFSTSLILSNLYIVGLKVSFLNRNFSEIFGFNYGAIHLAKVMWIKHPQAYRGCLFFVFVYYNTNNKMIIAPEYLCITNLLLVISFTFFVINSNKNIAECYLGVCLLLTIIFSQLFWKNPKQHSTIHKLDAIVAKISLLSFILYTILYKNLNNYLLGSYLILMAGVFYSFYYSNKYSSQEWCCDNHIIYHGCSHLFVFAGSFYAFL